MSAAEFNLSEKYAIERGLPWKFAFTWSQKSPRQPIDTTGMAARLEIKNTVRLSAHPWVFSSSSGHITLEGAAGRVEARLSAAETNALGINHAARYRLIMTGSDGNDFVLLRGKLMVRNAWL